MVPPRQTGPFTLRPQALFSSFQIYLDPTRTQQAVPRLFGVFKSRISGPRLLYDQAYIFGMDRANLNVLLVTTAIGRGCWGEVP